MLADCSQHHPKHNGEDRDVIDEFPIKIYPTASDQLEWKKAKKTAVSVVVFISCFDASNNEDWRQEKTTLWLMTTRGMRFV